MDSWTTRPLGEFLERITYGFTNPMPTTDDGPLMVTAKDINYGRVLYEQARCTSWEAFNRLLTDKSRPQIGDVLVTKDGTLGRIAVVERSSICINQSVALLRPSEVIRTRFLKYLLEEPRNFSRMLGDADGSTIKHIYITRLAKMEVSVPDLDTQDGILDALTPLDDKIELNRRMNETLEGMAQAIFRDWFVDFGPVRRKAAGAVDPVAIMGGLTTDPARAAQLATLFPAAFGENDLPMGWTFAPLSDLLVLQRGFDLPKTTRTDGDFPVIAASGPSGTHNEFKVKGPGVCTGRSGVLGGVYYVDGDFWPLNTSLWVKDYPGSTPLHAFHLLRGIDLAGFNAGSAVPTLNRNHIHGLPTVKPPMAVIEAFDANVGSFYAKMAAGRAENETLAETRDYLLPRLMSGEVRVAPKVEAI